MKIKKPDERIFRLTIEQLGCKPKDCLYVDDRRGNLGAADKVGMNTVLFNSRYDEKVVYNFKELAQMLINS